ncbi:hypothetical protein OHU17_33975 [Streptomyces goshikiensis]|uniref:Uncharacterized protein n=1 Tax=Streptomyces goshikiensis TaxID=1942 RepID=A0ABZ1RVR7_9ACTN|nr:hypothetical protein [Streptomyces goshikiensis]
MPGVRPAAPTVTAVAHPDRDALALGHEHPALDVSTTGVVAAEDEGLPARGSTDLPADEGPKRRRIPG